ncbi:MAG: ggt [Hydrocarboniphaga sp.]|uniref:gamma-glutamyltransferase n=1 Tax=Hydrocarboniphaga sp. TaxID=2033016 RepID=UPI00261BCA23|nr:gamma-glutamyltransferase [Hydrocarboniphaga sp.]MDB5972973.1 ggt [Hydrocarboniphaga sp.]
MRRILAVSLCLVFCVVANVDANAADAKKPGANAVASAHPAATAAGLEVLAAGGNAFDAAVAVTAAVAVVEPTGSGLGGGGFWLLHRESDDFEIVVDGRETAPSKASATMYLDASGKAVDKLSRNGPLSAAIPGEPAALDHIAKTYGKLTLARNLAPAIKLARDGFACDEKLARAFAREWDRLSPAAKATFAVDGGPPKAGALLRQPDLAVTLERLAAQGRDGFYRGDIGSKLVAGANQSGGIWSADDLARYEVVEREPVVLSFRDYRIVTVPPPSAGGATLGEVLNQLELLGWDGQGLAAKQQLIESMRRGYRDRAAYLGDSDFVKVPMTQLLSRSYARELVKTYTPGRATPSASLPPAPPLTEGHNTTHMSILDAEGNRVAATLSINLSFGSAYMAPGTGVFLNDEMDDFAASETASNAYGLIGSKANLVAPGKRPLSSMSPSFVEGPRGLLIVGSPGGSRIITMVLLGLLDWINGASAQQLVTAPRFHQQYLPDVVEYESAAFSADEQKALTGMGYTLKPVDQLYGNLQAVTWDPKTGRVDGAADPRGVGEAKVVPVH